MPSRITAVLAAVAAIGTVLAVGTGSAAAAPVSGPGTATILVRPSAGQGGLVRAEAAARELAGRQNVTVELAPGTYRLTAPLTFTAADAGRDGHTVTWTSAPGGTAALSGASQITNWRLNDTAEGIWEARVRPGTQTRQLFINGVSAPVAAIPLPRSDVAFTTQGLSLTSSSLSYLSALPDQSSIELESLGSFTDRYSPVSRITSDSIVMRQPAWDNNTWGYDTLPAPYNGGTMYLENSYAFLQPGQWYLDSARGLLYYRATAGQNPASLDVELPRLQSLVHISGSYASPVTGLSFRGISFTGTTWLQPSTSQGYADADANASGIGLGASGISVSDSQFTQDAASAIAVGGIQPDAHHPSNPAMTVRNISLTGNTITAVARDYKDSPGILSTYVDHAVISHNTLSDLPYDGIDLGWGWGTNDPGGNEYYEQAGLYSYQPVYETPTTLKDNVVSGNLIYDTKNSFYDGGSIYNLSASPGTVITKNYVYDNHDTFGVLLDQGSRYITMTGNVLAGCSDWVYVNADTSNVNTFHTMDNLMSGNWYNAGTAHAPDGPGYDNVVTGNTAVSGDAWPTAAQAVIAAAGAGQP